MKKNQMCEENQKSKKNQKCEKNEKPRFIGDIYVGCEQGQLLHVDCESLRVCMLYNPGPFYSFSDASVMGDGIKLGDRTSSELSSKSDRPRVHFTLKFYTFLFLKSLYDFEAK